MVRSKAKPGPTVTLTEEEGAFIAFLAGHYVGLLHTNGLDVQGKTKRSARAVAHRILKKLDASAAREARLERFRVIAKAYANTNTLGAK